MRDAFKFVCPGCREECSIPDSRIHDLFSIALCPCGMASTVIGRETREVTEADIAMLDAEKRGMVASFLRGGIVAMREGEAE